MFFIQEHENLHDWIHLEMFTSIKMYYTQQKSLKILNAHIWTWISQTHNAEHQITYWIWICIQWSEYEYVMHYHTPVWAKIDILWWHILNYIATFRAHCTQKMVEIASVMSGLSANFWEPMCIGCSKSTRRRNFYKFFSVQ